MLLVHVAADAVDLRRRCSTSSSPTRVFVVLATLYSMLIEQAVVCVSLLTCGRDISLLFLLAAGDFYRVVTPLAAATCPSVVLSLFVLVVPMQVVQVFIVRVVC